MTDLNKELKIEIRIPDPLKRQIPTRRFGSFSRNRSSRPFGRQDARDRRQRFGRKKDRHQKNFYGLRSRW